MVKFILKAFTIQTRPRAGYFVLDAGVIKCVKKVVPQKDKVVFTDESELTIADLLQPAPIDENVPEEDRK